MADAVPQAVPEGLKERRTEAVSRVVEEHSAFLLRAALGLGLPPSEAEDLVQETFAAFLEALERFEGRSSVRTYLYGILYRKNLERGRRAARELATDPIDGVFERRFGFMGQWSAPPQGPDGEALSEETSRLISECLEGLSDQQRAAFLFKAVEAQDGGSICNILGVTATHLRVLLFRARNKLRECLEGKWKGRP